MSSQHLSPTPPLIAQRSQHLKFPVLTFTSGHGPLARILLNQQLNPVFQPIIDLANVAVYAHEALIRGPEGSSLYAPDALLAAAADEGLDYEFQMACIVAQLRSWGKLHPAGRLFLNISASVLIELVSRQGIQELLKHLRVFGVLPRRIVMEITEHERVSDMDALALVVAELRSKGVSLALDDFGDGHSSLRLWSQLRPEIVKIDKYFVQQISESSDKLKTVRALMHIADIFETQLVAEGIENSQDLRVIRDLGISYSQGYYFGRPGAKPLTKVVAEAVELLVDKHIAVYPQLGKAVENGQINGLHIVQAPTLDPQADNNDVAALFLTRPDLHAVAVLDQDRPVAIINRMLFMNQYAKLYYREVSGRKSCMMNANTEPRLIEKSHRVDELLGILTSEDQRYLTDGFIVVENGRYLGLGTGDQLVRCVTETRIEAARHANPLTFLPGNIPISEHINRLLLKHSPFVCCYADLNNFKPFNDFYGYWRGDEMIRLLAKTAKYHCDSQRDFLGHVGGDDFILLFQSEDWRVRCERILDEFNAQSINLFDEEARLSGGIEAEDRHGVRRFFPMTTLSIGAVVIKDHQFSRAEEVANVAALAKHEAKQALSGLYVRT
jgi:diguanylate cyclase (GGDEF)-like protein